MNKKILAGVGALAGRFAVRGGRARAGAAPQHHGAARYLGVDALQPGQRRLAAVQRHVEHANGQTSRIYSMKNAIRAALAQVGTDEANFGLMRFPQLENAATTNCPAGHWSNGTTRTAARARPAPRWAATSAAG